MEYFAGGITVCARVPGSSRSRHLESGVDPKNEVDVGIYRESQISSHKSNFGLYHPNNSLEWLFQKMILRNPQAFYIWRILEQFENSHKIPYLLMKLVKISNDFKETVRARKNSC